MTLYKARPGPAPVPDLLLFTTEPIPADSGPDWESSWNATLQAQATIVVDALFASLPGGVLDRIAALMLQRVACQLAVPFRPNEIERLLKVEKVQDAEIERLSSRRDTIRTHAETVLAECPDSAERTRWETVFRLAGGKIVEATP